MVGKEKDKLYEKTRLKAAEACNCSDKIFSFGLMDRECKVWTKKSYTSEEGCSY